MTPPSQRGERAKRVKLWECCACGHIDTKGHACPKLNGLTSANGLGEFLPLSAVLALAEELEERAKEKGRDVYADADYAASRLRDLTNPEGQS